MPSVPVLSLKPRLENYFSGRSRSALRKFRSVSVFLLVSQAVVCPRANFGRVVAFLIHAVFFGLTASFHKTAFAHRIPPRDGGGLDEYLQKFVGARFGAALSFAYIVESSGRGRGFDSQLFLFGLVTDQPA